MVGAAFGIGFVIGPVIGGALGEFGHRIPFMAAAALAAINFVYGMTIFPETLKPENRRAFDWRRANPFGAFAALSKLPGVARLGVILLVWQVASLVYPLTWAYYLIASFNASGELIGASLAAVGISMAAVQLLMTGRSVARFGERATAMIGLICATIGFVALAVAPHWPWALLISLVMPVQSMVQPSISALISNQGNAANQGEVQGFTASMMALGSIIAPLLLNPTLAYFSAKNAPVHAPGAAFVISALLTLLTLAMVAALRGESPTPAVR